MTITRSPRTQFILALLLSSAVSELLFGYSVIRNRNFDYDYLSWNLALAWLPLILSIRLNIVLKHKLWSSWEALALSVAWLVFLPNSFYMISDFIHLQNVSSGKLVYDSLLLSSFVYTGVIIGFCSLFLVHLQLKRRFSAKASAFLIGATLFICSVGIYFGRDLRWNSWDVLTNPAGLLVDITDRLQHLTAYPSMTIAIMAFFLLLSTMYNLLWRGAHLFKPISARAAGRDIGR